MKIFFKHRLNTSEIAFLGVIGIVAIGVSYSLRKTQRDPLYDLKIEASRRTLKAYRVIKEERLKRGIAIDSVNDPSLSGLIGLKDSPITTTTGDLLAKQMSINPNWAALIVQLLKDAGVKKGDYVALHMTGSFPALNIAAIIAVETYGAKPIFVSSAGSSSWGANIPNFTWPDIERLLYDKGLIHSKSLLISLGGNNDIGAGLPEEGRNILRSSIKRNGYTLLEVLPLQKSINIKYDTLWKRGGGKIKAFINIGRSIASLGSHEIGEALGAGLNWPKVYSELSMNEYPVEGLVAKFLKNGVPVINLLHLRNLAKRYDLPLVVAAIPEIGEGKLFFRDKYIVWAQGLLLLSYTFVIFLVINGYLGRFFGNPRKEEEVV